MCLHMLDRNIKILQFGIVLKVSGNLMMTPVVKILWSKALYAEMKIDMQITTDYFFRSFRQRVNQNNKGNVFVADGKHTFFIPVDEGFKVVLILSNRWQINSFYSFKEIYFVDECSSFLLFAMIHGILNIKLIVLLDFLLKVEAFN